MRFYNEDLRVRTGQVDTNLEAMTDIINHAIESGYDCVLFPQLSLSGLHCNDLYSNSYFLDEIQEAHVELKSLSEKVDIVFGSVYQEDNLLYNAIFHYSKGQQVDLPIIKNGLTSYEKKYFNTKASNDVLTFGDVSYDVKFNLSEQSKQSIVFGFDPFHKHHMKPVIQGMYVNPVGISNVNNQVYLYCGSEGVDRLSTAMLSAIQLFDEEIFPFAPNWIVGVSGGLDSALTVALLSLSLGSDRVIGVNMPSEYSSAQTKGNAAHLASVLGYQSHIIPIGPMTQATQDAFAIGGLKPLENLAFENVQARLRGHSLMSFSSVYNGVICNNGNKIETALGYATLYGDAIGVIGLLGDLTKLEVGQLAQEMNTIYKTEVIPQNLIPEIHENEIKWEFAPSAELRSDQVDPMKWGYHDHLVETLMTTAVEDVMLQYLDGSIYNTKMGSYLKGYGLDHAEVFINDLEWVINTMNIAKYKRKQSPPLLVLSDNSFNDESQGPLFYSKKYQSIKDKILSQCE